MASARLTRFDRILVGFLIGIVAPLVAFLITYELKNSGQGLVKYIEVIWNMKIFLKIASLCAVPNLGIFFFFLQLKYEMAARGVVMATFIYALVVLIAQLI